MVRSSKALVGLASSLLLLCPSLWIGREPARAQAPACTQPGAAEPSGPTDISAVTGNQELTVAVNPDATVTTFRWPSPSFHDQIKYRTIDRAQPRMGTAPNEGAFVGLAYRSKGKDRDWSFDWLREWRSEQRFSSASSDVVTTTFLKSRLGLTVRITDVVPPDQATLLRDIKVSRSRASEVRRVRIFAFGNFNPVYSKLRNQHVADWCTEESNDEGATFIRPEHVVVHARSGIDQSTGDPSSVAVAFGFSERSDGHEVGEDIYETASGSSAYDDAADGKLSGSDSATGQADAAMFVERRLGTHRSGRARIVAAAAATQKDALKAFRATAGTSTRRAVSDKASWWASWLASARMPLAAPPSVDRLVLRSLISLRQATDPNSGLIVTSIATQPPLALDWVRHGAYINQALGAAGHPEMVLEHDLAYAGLQATSVTKPPGGATTPAGNWSQAFYADGVVGGAIPYEIDATGFGIWALWQHASAADPGYATAVYNAIQRAAHYLTDDQPLGCRDPASGLQCRANEEDDPNPSQTLVGAQAAWMGLGAAIEAANDRGTEESMVNAVRWQGRRDELAGAIRTNFFDEACACFTQNYQVGGTLLWPVGFLDDDPQAAAAQADVNFEPIAAAMEGTRTSGGMEARALLGNAHVWSSASEAALLRDALGWIAQETTTPGTHLLGGGWMVYPPESSHIVVTAGQPNNFHGAIYYLAALEVYGTRR